MTNGTKSVGKTKPTGSTPDAGDLAEAATQEALEKAKELAEELSNVVAESVAPPGTHIPRKKK